MAIFENCFKKISPFVFPIVVLVALVTYAFRDMLKMIVWGQGYEFLIKGVLDSFWNNVPYLLKNFQISSVLLSTLAYKFFGLNFYLYYWTWLVISLTVSILLFFLVYFLTKSKLAAFTAALIYSVSYVGQMGSIGWIDTSFIGRVPNLILLIPSFICLHFFLEKPKVKYYLIAISLFFLGLGLGHFGLLLAFAYVLYPLFWYLFSDKKNTKLLLVSVSFAVVSVFYIKIHSLESARNPQGPDYNFAYFLLHPKTYQYLDKVPVQLANWSNYPSLTSGVCFQGDCGLIPLGYKGTLKDFFTDIEANKRAGLEISLVYILVAILIYRRLPKQRAFLLTIIFATLLMFIENIYIDHYKPELQPGASRYLFYPTIWLAIFWALFVWTIFWKSKNKLLRFSGFAILAAYYLINSNLIQFDLNLMRYGVNSSYRKAVRLFDYIKKVRSTLKPSTLILTPPDELGCYEDIFLTEQIGKGELVFWPTNAGGTCLRPPGSLETVIASSAQVIRLNYDQDCDCVLEEKIK